jgi:hypothetical protein
VTTQGEKKSPGLWRKKKRWLGERKEERENRKMAKGREVQHKGKSHVQRMKNK